MIDGLKRTENGLKRTESGPKRSEKLQMLIAKAKKQGDSLTEKKIRILSLIIEDPYVSKKKIAQQIGLSPTTIWRNIEAMRGKYLRRVGPDKGGFWEIIE